MKIFFIYYFILGVFYACRTASANSELDIKDNFIDFIANVISWPACLVNDTVNARKGSIITTMAILDVIEHLKNKDDDNEDNA